jgi:hypothetical protein
MKMKRRTAFLVLLCWGVTVSAAQAVEKSNASAENSTNLPSSRVPIGPLPKPIVKTNALPEHSNDDLQVGVPIGPLPVPIEVEPEDPVGIDSATSGPNHELINKATPGPIPSSAAGIQTPNTLQVLQGMEFLSSPASEEYNSLLDDGNYFLELSYFHLFSPAVLFGAAVYFQQDFVVSNATRVAQANKNVGADQIIKANVIGMQLYPQYSFSRIPLYIRADLGGEMARDADENVDDTFNWRSDAVIGFEFRGYSTAFHAEVGYGIYEMLPQDDWRSIVRLTYVYDLLGNGLSGQVFLSTEFNGIEHSGNEQVRINIGYQMDPSKFFQAITGLFVASPPSPSKGVL